MESSCRQSRTDGKQLLRILRKRASLSTVVGEGDPVREPVTLTEGNAQACYAGPHRENGAGPPWLLEERNCFFIPPWTFCL